MNEKIREALDSAIKELKAMPEEEFLKEMEACKIDGILMPEMFEPGPFSAGLGGADPTQAQIESACLSYRHDYGLMTDEEKKSLQYQAKEWLHAWLKEFGLR